MLFKSRTNDSFASLELKTNWGGFIPAGSFKQNPNRLSYRRLAYHYSAFTDYLEPVSGWLLPGTHIAMILRGTSRKGELG